MLVVRPIGPQDQDALYKIAVDSGVGFTSLPINRDVLNEKNCPLCGVFCQTRESTL